MYVGIQKNPILKLILWMNNGLGNKACYKVNIVAKTIRFSYSSIKWLETEIKIKMSLRMCMCYVTLKVAPTPHNPMNEWHPHCPVLNSPFHLLPMPINSFMESIYLMCGLPLFLLPSIFSSIVVFSKEPNLLMICPK